MTPCEVDGNATEQFRIVGVDVAPSEPFSLDVSKGPLLAVNVSPGSLRSARRGLWILGAGGVLGVGGIATLLVGAGVDGFGSGGVVQQPRTDILFAGSMLVLAALGTGVWGAGTWAENHVSRVDGPVVARPALPSLPSPTLPQAYTIPLVSASF